jgi:myo-inositol-1-phosphate synthase
MVKRIRVGLVGIGNCFAGLIQGIEYYRQNPSQEITGIIHDRLAGYGIHDIDFVCGFDVGDNKVGKLLNEAIYEYPNMVNWIPKEAMPKTGAKVYQSPALDGVGIWVENRIKPIQTTKTNAQLAEEIKQIIKDNGVEIIVSYLPVGSDQVTAFWAQICLDTNTAFVNCIPSFIASGLISFPMDGLTTL